jgi:hypothetical protein
VGADPQSIPIPSPDSDWPAIEKFALTFNAYAQGGFEAVADAANAARDAHRRDGKLPASLDELRACLFFEQRRYRHFGRPPEGEELAYVRALVGAIRDAAEGDTRRDSSRTDPTGCAYAGSQLQIQLWVNCRRAALDRRVCETLPSLAAARPEIEWVSPIRQDGFAEYQDADFLQRVGLARLTDDLRSFWPKGGPCWDGLAVVRLGGSRAATGVLMVEAKSYPGEIHGGGCKAAAPRSRTRIEDALAATKRWLGAPPDADWTGPLYQSANRLAHLYFFTQVAKVPAWLLNVYFVNDPRSPTSVAEWGAALGKLKKELGLDGRSVPNAGQLLLEAGRREELLAAG